MPLYEVPGRAKDARAAEVGAIYRIVASVYVVVRLRRGRFDLFEVAFFVTGPFVVFVFCDVPVRVGAGRIARIASPSTRLATDFFEGI
jgi:hypothetical protein